MNFKKTEDNASIEQKRKEQMKSNEDFQDQQIAKNQQYEEGIKNQQMTIQQLKVSPSIKCQQQESKNPASETKILQGFINQPQSGVNYSKQGKEMQADFQQQQSMQSVLQQKKSSFANQVQEQYSKIKNPILTEIVSDENEIKTFLAMFCIVLAFWIEQVVFKEYEEFQEYIIIIIFILFTLGHYILLYKQAYRYLHFIQMVNSIIVILVIGMWLYNTQQSQRSKIHDYIGRLIEQENQTSNTGNSNTTSSKCQYQSQSYNAIVNDVYLLILQSQSKFFFQGAIIFRIQECLSRHLIPKYRLSISILSSLAILCLFYQQQYSLYDSLDYDIGIKCLFLIVILAFYEQVQMRNLCSYLISFQALKKYFTLSLCSRSCHGLSNNIQVEINPENLSSCKVIQGNQQLSELLLSNSLRFFREFQLDPQSISNYNKVDQVEDGDDRAASQDGDINNFDFGASTEKLKTNNMQAIRQKVRHQSKYSTVSKQFIDRKIMKCSSSSFNRKRNSKQSNPTIVSLKRFSQTEKIEGKEGEGINTNFGLNTHLMINKTDQNNNIPSGKILKLNFKNHYSPKYKLEKAQIIISFNSKINSLLIIHFCLNFNFKKQKVSAQDLNKFLKFFDLQTVTQ